MGQAVSVAGVASCSLDEVGSVRDLLGFALGAIVSLAGYAAARPLLRWLLTVISRTPLRVLTRV